MSGNGTHSYQTCRDPDCTRLHCQAYRDGYSDGFADGAASASDQEN